MTPGARIAAAIAVLDQIGDGAAAEKALTAWARGSRYAGSKDRAAVRDHVFDVLRARRSLGDGTGRELMQHLAVREGWPVDDLFSGEGHAPAALTAQEHAALETFHPKSDAARCDIPDWLWSGWQQSLGDNAEAAAIAQQDRADVFLRVNTRNTTTDDVIASLETEGVSAELHPTVPACLRVTKNPRRVKNTQAFADGLIELQDPSSQFAVRAVPVPPAARLLDYCAGGGGKALAFADLTDATVIAHDIAAGRMQDLPARAQRAGVGDRIKVMPTALLPQKAPYDVIFCDAPCSGSGTWRRTPDAKWRLTQERLSALMAAQDEVLENASQLMPRAGLLAYATCSVLKCENDETVARFIAKHPAWEEIDQHQLLPTKDGDGFFLSLLGRKKYNL